MDKISALPNLFFESNALYAHYARKRWAGERFGLILDDPLPDGSWNGSVADTIQQLYNRYLPGQPLTQAEIRGLNLLLETERPPMLHNNNDGTTYDLRTTILNNSCIIYPFLLLGDV